MCWSRLPSLSGTLPKSRLQTQCTSGKMLYPSSHQQNGIVLQLFYPQTLKFVNCTYSTYIFTRPPFFKHTILKQHSPPFPKSPARAVQENSANYKQKKNHQRACFWDKYSLKVKEISRGEGKYQSEGLLFKSFSTANNRKNGQISNKCHKYVQSK